MQREIKLPGVGSTGGFGGQRVDTDTFYTFTNFVTPSTIYRYDIASGQSSVYRQPQVDFDPTDYETKQHFVTSNDGTKVPVFVTSKRNLKRDGSHPTILYGYGGFDIALTPSFSVSNLVWMEMGGVYVVANLRGGSEYGSDWHESGMLDNKQNVFDDFISCAQWLIDQKITSSSNLAIRGGSNGGLTRRRLHDTKTGTFRCMFTCSRSDGYAAGITNSPLVGLGSANTEVPTTSSNFKTSSNTHPCTTSRKRLATQQPW